MAFHYFTFLDSGAPTLNGVNGSLTNSGNTGVLDWVLVTLGGWTKSFSSANASVFTPVSGNTVLYVAHDSALSGSAKCAVVRAGESATAVGTANLTNPFPTAALVADGSCCWSASNTADATARPYYGFVTDSFVFIWLGFANTTANYNTTNASSAAHFYGQFSKSLGSDPYNTVVSTQAQAGTAASGSCPFTNSVGSSPTINTKMWADRTADGLVFSPCQSITTPTGNAFGVLTGMPAYPNGLDNKLHLCKVGFCDTYAQSGAVGAKALQTRGYLPNIWMPLENCGALLNSKTFVDSSYNGAALFQLLFVTTADFLIIETTNTWSAPSV